MKELSLEQKTQRYDRALERAREWYNDPHITIGLKGNLEDIFPELVESEGERIRRCIGMCLTDVDEQRFKDFNTNLRDCLNWLEKQGEQKSLNDVAKEIIKNKETAKSFLRELANEYKVEQGEQKPDNKVEQKFKVGDWVVTSYGKVNQVVSVDEDGDGYTLDDDTYFSGSWKDGYHLWTIQDAKDGDVLVNGDEIVIFKKNSFNEKDLSGSMFVHCSLRDKKCSWYTIGGINPSNYLPATKAQRDKLFETMKEAGYKWDAEKKELKKINSYCQEHCKGYQETGKCYADGECEAKENAETGWSEEDKKMSRCIGNAITADDASTYLESKDIQVIDAHVWLDELKNRVQSKQDWSEDDKRIFGEIILRCEKYGNQEQIDWLKSLKERYTWSPSDEQMEAVKSAALDIAKFSSRSEQLRLENEPYYKALVSLYRDLQKLRE